MRRKTTKPKKAPKQTTCPNCGYCEHCGRAPHPQPTWVPAPWPYYQYPYPIWITTPTITTYPPTSGTVSVPTVWITGNDTNVTDRITVTNATDNWTLTAGATS